MLEQSFTPSLIPKFDYGCEVRVVDNIRNDTYLGGQTKGELLIRRGCTGFVRQSGVYKQEQIIYQVHFLEQDLTIGCKETELIDADIPWVNNKFEYGDQVKLNVALSVSGERVGEKDQQVHILAVDRSDLTKLYYRVQVGEHTLMVPEAALSKIDSQIESENVS